MQFSGAKANARLQEAIEHNGKDFERLGEALNAIRQRLHHDKDAEGGALIERFQNMEDRPYISEWGAAAIFDDLVFDPDKIKESKVSEHKHAAALQLVVMKGKDMMRLVHTLYDAAADEA